MARVVTIVPQHPKNRETQTNEWDCLKSPGLRSWLHGPSHHSKLCLCLLTQTLGSFPQFRGQVWDVVVLILHIKELSHKK